MTIWAWVKRYKVSASLEVIILRGQKNTRYAYIDVTGNTIMPYLWLSGGNGSVNFCTYILL